MILLDGKAVAQARQILLRQRIDEFKSKRGRPPGLAVVIVGEDPASQVYVKNKVKTTTALGMKSEHIELPATTKEADLLKAIAKLNEDPAIDGILVQMPLPKGFDAERVLESIRPEKDPDGLTSGNLGLLMAGKPRVSSCTPLGVMKILEHYKIETSGKRACVVGRSNMVGKPMALLLQLADATVTMCHSRTKDLASHTKQAEIVVVAAGREGLLGKNDFSQGAIVIDVGMHRPTSGPHAGKLRGDVRFEELDGWVAAATPVPGGVGPMTIQMLMENTVTLAELRERKN
ncbi:MAG: bifunctional methylenetetrahydrofolate dehydrogenase/methenyltetrahydrofolate cyclohydrolase FolD [Bdellovibrionota bacterium]